MSTKIIKKARWLAYAATSLLMSMPAFAKDKAGDASGLAGLATRGVDAVNAFNQLALGAFYLAGVVVFGIGCYLIYKEQGESGRGHGKQGVVGILIGGALLAMPSMIGLTTSTLVNKDTTTEACVGSQCNY